MRPRWMLRLGLFVYDHLGGRKLLPATSTIDLARDALGAPLKGRYEHGFEYSDCWVDDARLVVLNALDAAERGAVVRTRTRCVRVERGADWKLVLEVRGRRDVMTARALVNATGPWVGPFSETVLQKPSPGNMRLIAGSHIVVPRLFDHDRGLHLPGAGRPRGVCLPFEGDFTMVGTTDHDFSGDPAKVEASAEEIGYLCKVATDHFRTAVFPADVIWSFAGVRPLYDEESDKPQEKAQDTPRDYVLALDRVAGEAPLLTVYGGKITTYRRLAEEAYGKLAPLFGARPDWTKGTSAAGRRFRRRRHRTADRGTAPLVSVPERKPCPPPGARLRHAGPSHPGRLPRALTISAQASAPT